MSQAKAPPKYVILDQLCRGYGLPKPEYFENVKPLLEFKLNDLKNRIPEIEKEIEKMGAINMKALEDFESYRKEVEEVRKKADKLDEERKIVLEMIDKIEVKKINVFIGPNNAGKSSFLQSIATLTESAVPTS